MRRDWGLSVSHVKLDLSWSMYATGESWICAFLPLVTLHKWAQSAGEKIVFAITYLGFSIHAWRWSLVLGRYKVRERCCVSMLTNRAFPLGEAAQLSKLLMMLHVVAISTAKWVPCVNTPAECSSPFCPVTMRVRHTETYSTGEIRAV